MRMMMTCLHSASRSGSVTPKCEKWLMLMWPFFLVVFGVGFALDVYFFIFSDYLTLREGNILIERQLSGVRLRCQIGVIWFWLTPIDRECSRIGYFLTPLILNKLSGFAQKMYANAGGAQAGPGAGFNPGDAGFNGAGAQGIPVFYLVSTLLL